MTSFSEALQIGVRVFVQLLRGIGNYADIVDIVCPLVNFLGWVVRIKDEAQKARMRTTLSLRQSSVPKCTASKVECE